MAQTTKIILFTALSYFVAGWLGQLFAVPPGYATVIWPASGIAIAACLLAGYRAAIGVFIGSTLINVAITYDQTQQWVFSVSMLIALGSAIQTAVSYALVRRVIGTPLELHNVRHVLYFILLAGPLGCLISATVGTSVLLYFSIVPIEQASLNWLSWWLGDSVGVLVTVPWLVVLFRRQFKVYYDHPGRLIAALCLVALITGIVSTYTAYFELKKQHHTFQNNAELDSTLLSERIKNSVDILYGLSGYVRGSGQIYDYEFYEYSENLLRRDRAIKALSLNHVVSPRELDRYEALMSDMYTQPFQVKERNDEGELIPVTSRDRYIPVGIIYPAQANVKALGYDVYSEASRRAAIDEAIRLNSAYPTPAIQLVQESLAILMFLPVYEGQRLSSLATAMFDVEDLSQRVLGRHRNGTTQVYLIDRRIDTDPYVIAASDNADLSDQALLQGLEQQTFPVMSRSIIPVGAHHWELVHVSSTYFIEQPWGTHFVLVAGGFVAGLLGWVLSLIFCHAAQIERQVKIRTKELSQANAALRDYGEQLRQATESAQEANLAKSRFLANMSHEIRTPLNGLLGSMTLLQSKSLSYEEKKLVDLALQSGDSLMTLVNDILDLSKIEAGELVLEDDYFDIQSLLEDVSSLMYAKAQEKGLRLIAPQTLLPEMQIKGDRLRIRQVILNLLGNAIKFTEPGGQVQLQAQYEGVPDKTEQRLLTITVKDTGIGISDGLQRRLFQRFKQADTSTTRRYGGTGLGLAISKELIDAMEGNIGVESQLGQGASFWFTLSVVTKEQPALTLPESLVSAPNVALLSDNQSDMAYLKAIWHALGVELAVHRTLTEAPAADLWLLDQSRLSEPAVLAHLRQPNHPCVLLSEPGDVLALEGIHAPRVDKPIQRFALLSAVATAMSPASNPLLATNSLATSMATFGDTAKVLLVEDNLTNQIVAKGLLGLFGIVVDVAENGEEAIKQARSQRYDLIFMDCQMPVMDGYEATEHIRLFDDQAATSAQVPIIALSANAMKGDDELCFDAGMNDHVAKPIAKERLEAVLVKWLPNAQRS